jgi:hypothetical protein
MSVALSVLFTGLCALISGGDGKPGEILLVDTKAVGEMRRLDLPGHAPTLVMPLNELANPESSRPDRVVAGTPGRTGRVEQLGIWDLWGSQVRVRAQGGTEAGVRFFRAADGETSWPRPPREPQDPEAWRDSRYVADMSALVGDGRIDPALTSDEGSEAGHLPRFVAARVRLDAGLVQGAIPSQATYRDELFEFRAGTSGRPVRQALTDTVQWTMNVEASAVVIELTSIESGDVKRLLLAPSAAPHQLYISNLPAEEAHLASGHGAMNEQQMSALHFGAYYALLQTEPQDKPLPQLWNPVEGGKGSGLQRPFFCPPAVFTRK